MEGTVMSLGRVYRKQGGTYSQGDDSAEGSTERGRAHVRIPTRK